MEGMIPRGCLYIEASLFDKCPTDRGVSHRDSGFKEVIRALWRHKDKEYAIVSSITSNADCCFGSTQRMLICALFNMKEQEECQCFGFVFLERESAHIRACTQVEG